MLTKRKAPSAKNLTEKDVADFVERLGGFDLAKDSEFVKRRNALLKKLRLKVPKDQCVRSS